MKFVKKFLVLGLFALVWVSFCNAELISQSTKTSVFWNSSTWKQITWEKFWLYRTDVTNCWYCNSSSCTNNTRIAMTAKELYIFSWETYINCYSSTEIFKFDIPTETCPTCPTIDSNYCISNNLCPSCPSCPSQYTSLECQTEYNLIPVSSVTENYCTSNFDLISPADCPISSLSWDTQWSALFLNNVQYAGASNIYINVSEALDYSTTYIDSGSSFVFDVDWYVADTWYLNDILTVQEYHPSSEDFTTAFVSVLTLWLPYVVVALFVLLVRKLVKKIFKS